jgi:hypothetical protein
VSQGPLRNLHPLYSIPCIFPYHIWKNVDKYKLKFEEEIKELLQDILALQTENWCKSRVLHRWKDTSSFIDISFCFSAHFHRFSRRKWKDRYLLVSICDAEGIGKQITFIYSQDSNFHGLSGRIHRHVLNILTCFWKSAYTLKNTLKIYCKEIFRQLFKAVCKLVSQPKHGAQYEKKGKILVWWSGSKW